MKRYKIVDIHPRDGFSNWREKLVAKVVWADDLVLRKSGEYLGWHWGNVRDAEGQRYFFFGVKVVEAPEENTAVEVLRKIQFLLSGNEWDSDTLSTIAEILRSEGYPVLEVDGEEESDE